jgi:hypothetical protein
LIKVKQIQANSAQCRAIILTIELFNFATIWFEVMLSAVSTDLGLLEIVDFSAFFFS